MRSIIGEVTSKMIVLYRPADCHAGANIQTALQDRMGTEAGAAMSIAPRALAALGLAHLHPTIRAKRRDNALFHTDHVRQNLPDHPGYLQAFTTERSQVDHHS